MKHPIGKRGDSPPGMYVSGGHYLVHMRQKRITAVRSSYQRMFKNFLNSKSQAARNICRHHCRAYEYFKMCAVGTSAQPSSKSAILRIPFASIGTIVTFIKNPVPPFFRKLSQGISTTISTMHCSHDHQNSRRDAFIHNASLHIASTV